MAPVAICCIARIGRQPWPRWAPGAWLVVLTTAALALGGCAGRGDPPGLVHGDAYLDPSRLTTDHAQSWTSSQTWEAAAVEALLIERLGALTTVAGHLTIPASLHLTLRVKDTSGDLLAEHALAMGHNRWRDVIRVEPLDLYLRIATWRFGHDVLLLRSQHPHGHALDINVIAALMQAW